MRRKVSRRCVKLVAEFEGFSAYPYTCPAGVWTIGYGHTKGVTRHTRRWSKRRARRVLRRELNRQYAPSVRALRLPLTQHQFDALVSFVYNCGPGAISNTTGIGQALRAKRWYVAADELLEWNRGGGRELPGLTRRRRAERRLFLCGLR